MGPTLIIWCTIGVSASRAPAIRAMRGLHTPQQITQMPVSMSPAVVRTARTWRLLPHQGAGPERVDHAHGREVPPAQNHGLVEVRHQFAYLGGGEHRGGYPPRLGRGAAAAQFGHPLGGARHLDPAALGEDPQLLVLLGAVPGQLHHHLRVLDREDEVGGVPGGPARVGHRALVHQHEVAPPQQRQVVDEAVADDARAHDHGAGPGRSLSHAAASRLSLVSPLYLPTPPGMDTAPPPALRRRGRCHAALARGATPGTREGRDDAVPYSTGISLLIRPRSMPCLLRISRAAMYSTIASTYMAAM